ncbi:PEP-CTERM sorting domain-containing protein [Tolypothrix sp. PCC 7910]|uniref:PEP-CTERM sorting domain-containing protein n=1 Tax=Tolypothrix sp. PCC 7910 TaxID=2099387 RepID=UPI0014279772|nr:PEP-CTERM sorting domain-containing protein [Tolypothrix sp. PCC 7910]QIR39501.1 PEP-CTERM sorting domain-containing protein [Tolypothrix sp. PCC 7910]
MFSNLNSKLYIFMMCLCICTATTKFLFWRLFSMRWAKKLGIATFGLAIGLAGVGLPSAAQALVFDFSYTAGSNTASGTLTTNDTPDGSGYYIIQGITGFRNTEAITGVVSTNGYTNNNNLFNPTAPYFTGEGFSYTVASGSVNIRAGLEFDPSFTSKIVSDFTASAGAPEPSDIGGLAILLGIGGLMVRKFKSSQKSTTFIAETKAKTLVS